MTAVIAVLVIAVQLPLRAQAQRQQNPAAPRYTLATASYSFLIASGILCENADGCPAVAQAGDGDTIAITGAGTLNAGDKSVTGAGSFIEKTSAGAINATGIWTATGLASFQPYGVAPFALLRDYPQLRTARLFSMGRPMMSGFMTGPMAGLMGSPLAAGGVAVIRIHLIPDAGVPQDAILRVNCAKGKVPEDDQTDGVKLAITGGPSFDVQVTGRTVFLLHRPVMGVMSDKWRATSNNIGK
jgi:hypothetical protein